MKHILTIGAAAVALVFTACDNIDEADRLIPIEFQKTDKVVLIEEFTGANCPNCPAGAEIVASLHELWGDNVLAVSMYPKQLTDLTRPYNVDLRTDLATEIFAAYNTENMLPAAMFNRQKYEGKILQTASATWGATVNSILNNPDDNYSPVEVQMTSDWNPSTRTLAVDWDANFLMPVDQDLSFQIYVVENGITSIQATGSGLNLFYENNHVLRTSMYGTWGQEIGAAHNAGSTVQGATSVTIPADWKPENIQVIGFVCNTGGDRVVLNASMIKSIVNE